MSWPAAMTPLSASARSSSRIKLGADLRQIAAASPDYLARRGTPQHSHDLGWALPARYAGHSVRGGF